jgi:serine/tyrosine/threonine adenylyltransferase
MRLGFQHTFAGLPSRFYAQVAPTPVRDPRLVVFNKTLAAELGLDAALSEPEAAGLFSGNLLPEDANPISMA